MIRLDTSRLDALRASLPKRERALQTRIGESLQAQIAAGWSAHSPSSAGDPPAIDTGTLASSLHADSKRVGTPLSYARLLEFGTSRMAARPWLRPAVELVRGEIPQWIREVFHA